MPWSFSEYIARCFSAGQVSCRAKIAEPTGAESSGGRDSMENFSGLVAEIFDRMDRAAGGEKHFALRDSELRMLVAAGEKGDKHFPFQAVAEFVGVRVPMRLAEAFRIQREPVDGSCSRMGNLDLLMAVLTPQSLEIWSCVVRNEVLWGMPLPR